jgi:hypothetical protein
MAARTWGGILVVLLTMGALTAVANTGSFVDDDDSVHQADIEAIAAAGITKGCNPPANDRFCPDEAVTRRPRWPRSWPGPWTCSLAAGAFSDVGDSEHAGDIARLAGAGITKGCNPPDNDRFCPEEPVTRAQMASLLVRAELAEVVTFTVTVDGVTYLIPEAACLATPADEALLRQIVAESGEETRQLALRKWSGYPTTTMRFDEDLDTDIRDSAVRSIALGMIAGIDDVVVAWWRAWEPYFFGPGDHPFTVDEAVWRERAVELVAAIEAACA